MSVSKKLWILLLVGILLNTAERMQAETLTTQKGESGPGTEELVQWARDQQVAGKMRLARKSFKKALAQSSGRSVVASVGVVQTCLALGDLKGAADAGGVLEALLLQSGDSQEAETDDERAAAHMSLAMVRLQEVRAIDLRYEPSPEAVRSGRLSGRWEKERTRALTSARSALASAFATQPQRASLIVPLLVDALFALDERTEACGLVERMRGGPGEGGKDDQSIDVSRGEFRRFQCLCAARAPEELRLAYGEEFEPPVSVERGVPPQIREPGPNPQSRTIVVDQVIDTQGRVACQLIRKSLGDAFDAEALASFGAWRFSPATVRGEPIVVFHRLVFQIQGH